MSLEETNFTTVPQIPISKWKPLEQRSHPLIGDYLKLTDAKKFNYFWSDDLFGKYLSSRMDEEGGNQKSLLPTQNSIYKVVAIHEPSPETENEIIYELEIAKEEPAIISLVRRKISARIGDSLTRFHKEVSRKQTIFVRKKQLDCFSIKV